MSAVSLAPVVPMRRHFATAHGVGLYSRATQGLVARAISYPDQFNRRHVLAQRSLSR